MQQFSISQHTPKYVDTNDEPVVKISVKGIS